MEFCTAVWNCGRLIFLFLFVFRLPSLAAIAMELAPLTPSPSKLGTVIRWRANSNDINAGSLLYRFSAGPAGGSLQVVKDFSSSNELDWTTIDSEGLYVIQLDVLNQ